MPANPTTTTPPNFLFLVSEDVGIHHGCYGNPYAHTPHIDRLASEGVRYTHAFTTCPVCAPSRSTMVTGQYPYAIGTHLMRCVLLDPPRLFTHELQDAGYHVAWPTKLDFNFEPTDNWCTNTDPWWEQAPPTPPDQPFFLFRNFGVTHESAMWRTPEEQAQATPDVPDKHRHRPEDAPIPDDLFDCAEVRHQQVLYHDSLTQADHEIGQCLKWLDDHNLRDSTIVVYLSDHGCGLPRNKRWCFDPGIHMPLIIRFPNNSQFNSVRHEPNSRRATHARPGSTRNTLVSWVDLAPTILTLAGVPVPDHYQGQPFLNPDGSPPATPTATRTTAFGGRDRMDAAFDHVRYVRDHDYLYLRNSFPHIPYAQRNAYMEQASAVQAMREANAAGQLASPNDAWFRHPKPAEELYRPADDPYCIHNLIDDPTHQDHANRLRSELDEHLEHIGDLGTTDETDLIAQGLIEDQIDAMRSRKGPLPDHLKLGPDINAVTWNEAVAESANA
ncbi:MAG: sulfatase [Planctomycetota bacterium]